MAGLNTILGAQEALVAPGLVFAGPVPASGAVAANPSYRTLGGPDVNTPQNLAAAGTGQSTAGVITGTVVNVSGSDGTKGVVLPAPVAGQVLFLGNSAANTLIVYPSASGTINGASSYTGGSSKMVIVWCTSVSSGNGTYFAMTG